jgi:hypothetical protein
MKLGMHEDYNTEEGIAFGIPILYSAEPIYHPNHFVNGDQGRPWLVSLMLYATSEHFRPEYGLGTVFCESHGNIDFKADARHMRFVLFEGDIIHSIEESKHPQDTKPWRISYVFKLIINPKEEKKSMKKAFSDLIHTYILK